MAVPKTEFSRPVARQRILRAPSFAPFVLLLAAAATSMPALPGSGGALASVPVDMPVAALVLDTLRVHGLAVADDVFPVSPGIVTVVDLENEGGGGDLPELLARVAGVQVRRYGGLGSEAVASVRGSTGPQVQVLVDGLPLADAQTGAINLSLLPLERFDRAEIHRGLVPAGFGGVGAAGAVNLRTRPGHRDREVRLFGGSHGDVGGRMSQSLASADGSRRGMLLAHGRWLDNGYTYTPWIPAWAGEDLELPPRKRENADLAEWGLFGQGDMLGTSGHLRLAAGFFRRDGGRPGPQNALSPHARVRHERADARLSLAGFARALALDVALSRSLDRLDDAGREVGYDPYDRVDARGSDALGRLIWSPKWSFGPFSVGTTAGGDWRQQTLRQTSDGSDAPLRRRRTATLFAGLAVDVLPARFVLHPAWRWQRIVDNLPPVPPLPWLPEETGVRRVQDAASPSLGASWHAVPGWLIIEGHWHETVRQPTWIELFGQPGGLVGNRALEPERINGRDVGLRLSWPRAGAALRVTGFDQRSSRTIIYYMSGPGMSRPLNIGRARTRGVELEGAWRRNRYDLVVNSTWQNARDRGGEDSTYLDKALPYLSDHECYGELRVRLGSWRPGAGFLWQSASYRDRYNLEANRAAARSLWNLSLARVLRGGVWGSGRAATLTAEVLNLTGNQIHDVEGYPLPGRSVRLSLHWH